MKKSIIIIIVLLIGIVQIINAQESEEWKTQTFVTGYFSLNGEYVDFPVFKVFTGSSSSSDPELDIMLVRFDVDQKNIVISGIPENHLQKSVDLISGKGQIIKHKNIPQNSNYFQFECGDLELGIYLIRINLGDQTQVRKVFVRHLE